MWELILSRGGFWGMVCDFGGCYVDLCSKWML